jgi:hypothetical protein
MHKKIERRSLALHIAIVRRLREDPSLWDIPLQNIARWAGKAEEIPVPYCVWREILTSYPKDNIVKLLMSRSERAIHLRSSSPFTGIISQEARNKIFKRYKKGADMDELERVKNELENLKQAVREYLERPSTDGRPDRQEMRRRLAELVKEGK